MSKNLYTIEPAGSFADTLVAGILARYGDDPLTLSDIRIYLPTRRACRAVSQAFLRQSNGKAMILPRLIPLGDPDSDNDAMMLAHGDDSALNLPPAISDMRRRLMLARLIRRAYGHLSTDQAASLSSQLVMLLDQTITEGLSFDTLDTLVSEDFARHWQITLDFLKIITQAWPEILREEHLVDPATRRDALIRAQAELWQKHLPEKPVIAAGSTGSVPAVAELLTTIANLPNGHVILPALDTHLENGAWNTLSQTHPQWGMRQLLDKMGVQRDAVQLWHYPSEMPAQAATSKARFKLMSEVMRPAETSDFWQSLEQDENFLSQATENLFRLDCSNESEEAAVISLIMREALEDKAQQRTAMLVTPDRNLARRVVRNMARWGVTLNDSAGTPLSLWPLGGWIGLGLSMLENDFHPVTFLALLKHPLTSCAPSDIALLEQHILRGPRLNGLDGIKKKLANLQNEIPAQAFRTLENLINHIENALAPLTTLTGAEHTIDTWARAHIAAIENLATTDTQSGKERLWVDEDGEAAARALSEMIENASAYDIVNFADYAALVRQLVLAQPVRPKTPAHPRLTILSPMESRLISADVVILGSLNEGTWPRTGANDPWMSRPMRSDFGLPTIDRHIGLAAHDFVGGFCAGEVYLTRADRVDDTPTVPSRWLMRLDTVLEKLGADSLSLHAGNYKQWAADMDAISQNDRITLQRPAPCPPAHVRPSSLSFTDVERWVRDPYTIYAKHILRLRKMDDLDADMEARDKGTLFHDVFEKAVRETLFCSNLSCPPPSGHPEKENQTPDQVGGDRILSKPRVLSIGQEVFDESGMDDDLYAIWWPAFTRLTDWFVSVHNARVENGIIPIALETKGRHVINEHLTIHGRADRIDRHGDGSLEIIDYKTGTTPAKYERLNGYAPQLNVESITAKSGGFENVQSADVSHLTYWPLKSNVKLETLSTDAVETAMAQTQDLLLALIENFYGDHPAPYLAVPNLAKKPAYNDYEHLERLLEWGSSDDDGGGE